MQFYGCASLHELFRVANHLVEQFPRLLWIGQDKLLNFVELVHSENAPHVPAAGPGLFPVACAVAAVLQGEILGLNPLVGMEGADRLLAGCNEILLVLFSVNDLV